MYHTRIFFKPRLTPLGSHPHPTTPSNDSLEVLPGLTVWQMLLRDWKGEDVNQIGTSLIDGIGWLVGWVGLGWVGLGWVGLGWVGLGWVGLG